MVKPFLIKLSILVAQVVLALLVTLPIYTHFFDLFTHLVDKGETKQAQIKCEKNQVIALAQPGNLCIHRSYGLAIGTPPVKEDRPFLELLEKDILSSELCECIISSAERFNIPKQLLVSELSWEGQRLLITDWYCMNGDDCNIL